MPWVVRDAVDEINRAVGRRWQGLDPFLPPRAELPDGCAAPFLRPGFEGERVAAVIDIGKPGPSAVVCARFFVPGTKHKLG